MLRKNIIKKVTALCCAFTVSFTGLPEINVFFVLKNVENMVHSELLRKIELENEENKEKDNKSE